MTALALLGLAACDSPEPRAWGANDVFERSGVAVARDAWVVAEIEARNASLTPSDRAAKYCKMAASPFVFYRGTNHLFWHDLAGDPRFDEFGGGADTRIWLQGDLHPDNYGSHDNDEGAVVYDLNDFDEVVIGDYQWDVWRMATGLTLLATQNGMSGGATDDILDAFSERYLDTMASYRGNDDERDQIFTSDATYGLLDDFLIDVEDHESRENMLDDWTWLDAGVRRFDLDHPDLEPADPAVVAAIQAAWSSYVDTTAGGLDDTPGYFTIKDVARRVNAGTGSLGTPRYYVLIEGAGGGQSNDHILDVKRQGSPSGYVYLSAAEQAQLDAATLNHAERTLAGNRGLVAKADDHLGWLTLSDGDYSVRERSPFKDTFPTEQLDSSIRFEKLAEQWGAVLATDHARADKDYRATVIAHSLDKQVDVRTDGAHAEFRALVRDVAVDYEAQVDLDHAAFASFVAGQQLGCP